MRILRIQPGATAPECENQMDKRIYAFERNVTYYTPVLLDWASIILNGLMIMVRDRGIGIGLGFGIEYD
eukprot:492099-Amorphochlora_amoeboformis.AAC.1